MTNCQHMISSYISLPCPTPLAKMHSKPDVTLLNAHAI